jgi:hypothetical protein
MSNLIETTCLNCGNSEMEVPLIAVRIAGGEAWICSPCMPVLIHKPEQMVGALQTAGKISAESHQGSGNDGKQTV